MTQGNVTAMLLAVAVHGLPSSLPASPRQALDPAEWRDLLGHARRERITPVLAHAVANGSVPATDTQTTEALDLATSALASVLTLEATLLQVAETLEHAGVPFRVLKGPAVAHLDYPDASLRDFGDIDLLIHPDDLDHTIAVLAKQGYARRFPEPRTGFDRRFTKSVSVVNRHGLELDLHRTLAPGMFGLQIPVTMLWDAEPARFVLGGRTLPALGLAERFMHACYHATLGNAPPRLVPQRDIAQMLLRESVDLDRVQTLATAWQGEAVVTHAITTARKTLRLSDVVALSSWAAEHPTGSRQQRRLARATSPRYSYAAQALDNVRVIGTVRDRVVYVSALAFPRRSYLVGRHTSRTSRVKHAFFELVSARHVGPTADP
jgi:hypothetical protein